MIKKLLALFVVATFVATLFAGCGSSSSSKTIKIGAIQPISGPVSAYGTQSRDAINMAVAEINAKGGVLGKTLEVIVDDDAADPEKAKIAFTKLVTKDKVIGIVGALTSKCSLAITADAQARKIIMISPSSTNDAVTNAGDYIFRACYKDSFQGPVVAQYAINDLKSKNAAILFDNTNDYSVGMKDNFKAEFEKLGGTVVAVESYATGDKDFNAQLTKIKATNPDVLFLPDYYNTVSLIAKQVKQNGITAAMMGADGWDEIANNAGDEVIGSYYSNHYAADAKDADVKTFVDNFKAKYKDQTPNALAALAYDATYILAEAIIKAGSTEPEKIKAAMMETNRKFVTGNISFDAHRDPIKSITMVKLVKGTDGKPAIEFAGIVNPK
ncbi:MAG TPA: ABC transporter substrate-binding protein [Ruminiclostridium sp.]